MSLALDDDFVVEWSEKYRKAQSPAERSEEDRLFGEVGPTIRARGHMTRAELVAIGGWKSQRPRRHVDRNNEERVHQVTALAFQPETTERLSVLTALHGVLEKTASAILTVWQPALFTVYDYRAVEVLEVAHELEGRASAGLYLAACRAVADGLDLPDDVATVSALRALDRAMWQFHKAGMPGVKR